MTYEPTPEDHLALDALADWLGRNPPARGVETALELEDGTLELVLRHEHGIARSVTNRTLGKALTSALAIARVAGAD